MQARDVMSKWVVAVPVGASIFEAAELLVDAEVSAAPVIDKQGRMVGIVSEADLMRRAEIDTVEHKTWLLRLLADDTQTAREYVRSHSRRVADVMTRKVITAAEDASLNQLAELMHTHNIKRVPIVRDGVVVGIVSRGDLLEALLTVEAESAPCSVSDGKLRETVNDVLSKQSWTSPWPTNVVVSDGVVHLWGFVSGEAIRQAYRVAAENVPGVRRVKNHLRPVPAGVNMGV